MASMFPYVTKPHPLISSRIEYVLGPAPPLPSITPRIEFTAERLTYSSDINSEGADPQVLGSARRDSNSDVRSNPPHEESGPLSPISGLSNTESTFRSLRMATRSRGKIPKPVGEPGRPGSGGFCVEDTLVKTHGWPEQSVSQLTEAVRAEAKKQLNITTTYRSQNKRALQKICDMMMEEGRWPELKAYENCWPVHSILKLTLKYSAEASRRALTKSANQRMRAALRGSSPDTITPNVG